MDNKDADLSLASLTLDCQDSINIIGKYKAHVEAVRHPNLVNFVDCFRHKNERVTFIYEHFDNKLVVAASKSASQNNKINFVSTVRNLFDALNHLHNNLNIYHGLITPNAIVWAPSQQQQESTVSTTTSNFKTLNYNIKNNNNNHETTTLNNSISNNKNCSSTSNNNNSQQEEGLIDATAKLSLWPINFVSSYGDCFESHSVLPEQVSYNPPEHIKDYRRKPSASSDIWSLCLSLLKLIKPSTKIPENPANLALCDSAESILKCIDGYLSDEHIENSSKWNEFFLLALNPNPETRATLPQLEATFSLLFLSIDEDNESTQKHEDQQQQQDNENKIVSKNCANHHLSSNTTQIRLKTTTSTCINDRQINNETVTLESNNKTNFVVTESSKNFEEPQVEISTLNIDELYYLWRLSAGRKYELEQKQDDIPPIFKIPSFIPSTASTQSKDETDRNKKKKTIISTKSKLIDLKQFKADLQRLDAKIFLPFVLTKLELLDRYNGSPILSRRHIPSCRENDGGGGIGVPRSLSTNFCNTSEYQSSSANNDKLKSSIPSSLTFADLDFLSTNVIVNGGTENSSADFISTNSNEFEFINGGVGGNSNYDDSYGYMSCGVHTSNEIAKKLPIVIKEADFAYQCERVVLFKRLLSFFDDEVRETLVTQSFVDIPPYFRAQVWAILLKVSTNKSETEKLYSSISKTVASATERQISVDIPRCHQYNELMASTEGHEKLARILKAWLNLNKAEYVYWQGLDSLAAPFLLLNFNDEATAFACFNVFVNKYLRGFFRQDNQIVVHQYLSMFSALLSFHDPLLANHLDTLGFQPNLYAIPWFLTMFTHVLPLHKILHVWDKLLLADEKFPLCIGLAILKQLRQDLLEYSFNDCIVAFSDLPEVDIERCVKDATFFYNATPIEY